MRRFCIIAAFLWGAAAVSAAEDPKKPADDAQASPPTLVDTAKDAKAKRKASKTKVIRNSDVKKSKGKSTFLPPADAPVVEKKATVQDDEHYRARREAKERIAAAEKKVTELDGSVKDLEQQYYETNDPSYRDDVIRVRFDQAKRQLDEARQQLADARDALKKIDQPATP